jgi:sensor histidine kinase YesM
MKNKTILFWLLQIIGWGLPTGINVWGKLVMNTKLSKTYIYLEGFGFLLSGIIASLIVRWFLKKRLSFQKFKTKEFKTAVISLGIGGLLLFLLLFIFSTLFYFITHHALPKISSLEIISTLLNSYLFILFWLLIYLSIKIYRINNIEKVELESSLKESQLNTLIGQINPHFMFNSLNNIRALMLEDIDKSREMITRLSDMLRYSLTKNSLHKIAIADELEMVENYIELSKIQLENRLEFKKEIDSSILGIEIPPMIIQMLIENAVKHGISNLPNGGLVMLKVLIKGEQLIIRVCNSGKLIMDKNSTKVGVNNIKKRLSLMYGNKAVFSLKENEDMVTAMIKIPL